jgi:hypothetical protein
MEPIKECEKTGPAVGQFQGTLNRAFFRRRRISLLIRSRTDKETLSAVYDVGLWIFLPAMNKIITR